MVASFILAVVIIFWRSLHVIEAIKENKKISGFVFFLFLISVLLLIFSTSFLVIDHWEIFPILLIFVRKKHFPTEKVKDFIRNALISLMEEKNKEKQQEEYVAPEKEQFYPKCERKKEGFYPRKRS